MKKLALTGTFLAALFTANVSKAQEVKDGQLIIGGQVRPRFEFRNGFKRPLEQGQEAAGFMEQRGRLNAMYKASNYNIKLSFQDVRIWGDVGQINKSDGLSSFHEAYGEWLPNKKVALRIGRQEFVYNDSRILGNLDWAAQGRSHDAVKFVYTDSLAELHIMATYNQDGTVQEPAKLQSSTAADFNPLGTAAIGFKLPNPYMSQMAYYKRKFGKNDFSFLLINDVIQKIGVAGSVARLTVGIDPNLVVGKMKFSASAYLQTGKESASMNSSAFLGSLTATYTGGKKITPTLGIDILSGDDTTSKKINEAFDPLYGTHHAFYGYMDYFYVGSPHGNRGLIDIYLKTDIKFKNSKLMAHAHAFMSQADNYNAYKFAKDKTKESAKYLGTEVDLVYAKPITKNIKFNLGTSFMFAADGIKSIKSTTPAVAASGTTPAKTASNINAAKDGFTSYTLNNWTWAMIDFTF